VCKCNKAAIDDARHPIPKNWYKMEKESSQIMPHYPTAWLNSSHSISCQMKNYKRQLGTTNIDWRVIAKNGRLPHSQKYLRMWSTASTHAKPVASYAAASEFCG